MFFDAAMNLFRAATRHGSMVIIINDNVDEKRRIVSSISSAMDRAVLSIATYIRSNIECHIYMRSPVDWQNVKGLLADSRGVCAKLRNIELKV